MNHKEETEQLKTEQAYRDMREQELAEMPDLWNRIEAGFEEEKRQSSARKKIYRRRYLALAAAALLIMVIAIPVITRTMRTGQNKSDTDNAAVDNAVMESAEESSSDSMQLDTEEDEVGTSAAWEDAAAMEQAEEQSAESVMTDAADAATEAASDDSAADDQTVNAADSAQADASASEGMIDNPTAVTYRQITEVTLVLTDASGRISQRVTADDSADGFEQVQDVLREYAIFNWPTQTEDDGDSDYKLTVVMEDGKEYNGWFRADSEYNGKRFSEFADAFAK